MVFLPASHHFFLDPFLSSHCPRRIAQCLVDVLCFQFRPLPENLLERLLTGGRDIPRPGRNPMQTIYGIFVEKSREKIRWFPPDGLQKLCGFHLGVTDSEDSRRNDLKTCCFFGSAMVYFQRSRRRNNLWLYHVYLFSSHDPDYGIFEERSGGEALKDFS
jgi:hypothetical protein